MKFKKGLAIFFCFLPFIFGCETTLVVDSLNIEQIAYSSLQERVATPFIHEGNWPHLQDLICRDSTSIGCLRFQEFLQGDVPFFIQDGEFLTAGDFFIFDINTNQVEKAPYSSIHLHVRKEPNKKTEFQFVHGKTINDEQQTQTFPIRLLPENNPSPFQKQLLTLFEQQKPPWTSVQVCNRSVCTSEETKPGEIKPPFSPIRLDVVIRQKADQLLLLAFFSTQENNPKIKVLFSSMPWLTPQTQKDTKETSYPPSKKVRSELKKGKSKVK